MCKDDIVIMNNMSAQKVSGVKEAIESTGTSLLYLPPYSPDLNPIEMMWSKIKAFIRMTKLRSSETIAKAIFVLLLIQILKAGSLYVVMY